MKKLVSVLAFFVLICTPVWAEEVPDLIGNWTGESAHISIGSPPHNPGIASENMTYNRSSNTTIVIIEEQNDRLFSGKLVHNEGGLQIAETLFGVIGFDNKTIYMVDEDGYHDGRLISPTEMELIYRKAGPENMIIAINRFIKAS